MSDADGRYIPLTEDDQGEGVKDLEEESPFFNHIKKAYLDQKESTVDNESWEHQMLTEIKERLDEIESHMAGIRQAIGSHVLISGRWVDPTNV